MSNFEYPAWLETYSFYNYQFKAELPLYTGQKLKSLSDLAKRKRRYWKFSKLWLVYLQLLLE